MENERRIELLESEIKRHERLADVSMNVHGDIGLAKYHKEIVEVMNDAIKTFKRIAS